MRSCPPTLLCSSVARLSASSSSRSIDLALVVVERADLGGGDAARAAMQQPRAQPLLERGHVLGRGGLRDAELGGGLAEAAGLDHADEELQPVMRSMARAMLARSRAPPAHSARNSTYRPLGFTERAGAATIAATFNRRRRWLEDEGGDGRGAGDGKGRRDAGLRRARRGDQSAVRGAARARSRSRTCWRATSRARRTWPRATRAPRPATSACASAPRARPAPT